MLLLLSNIEQSIRRRWGSCHQERQGDVVNRDSSCCLTFEAAVMRMAVDGKEGLMAINDL